MTKPPSLFFLATLLLAGCTTTGMSTSAINDHDFSAMVGLDICVLQESCVPDKRALIISNRARLAFEKYGLDLRFTYQYWKAPSTPKAIMKALEQEPLEAPCDRLFAYMCRDITQKLKGWVISTEGVVSDEASTRGFAYVQGISLNSLALGGDSRIVVHEIEHLVGCGHGLTKTDCYRQIKTMKDLTFPPAWSFAGGRWIMERQ